MLSLKQANEPQIRGNQEKKLKLAKKLKVIDKIIY